MQNPTHPAPLLPLAFPCVVPPQVAPCRQSSNQCIVIIQLPSLPSLLTAEGRFTTPSPLGSCCVRSHPRPWRLLPFEPPAHTSTATTRRHHRALLFFPRSTDQLVRRQETTSRNGCDIIYNYCPPRREIISLSWPSWSTSDRYSRWPSASPPLHKMSLVSSWPGEARETLC